MRLERMHLLNFRCFEDLTIEFHDKLTVLVAENGAGKTALLDAIALGFGRYLSKLPGVKGQGTKDGDLRVAKGERREPYLRIAWEARIHDDVKLVWSGGRRRDAAVSILKIKKSLIEHGNIAFTHDLKAMDEYALGLVKDESEKRPFFLPVIAYYGTNRAIREEVQRRRGFRKSFSRFEALEGALDPDSRFRAAFEWFNAMEDEERREQIARKDFNYRHPALQTVKAAIVRMLPVGVSNPRTETRPLRFVVDRMTPDGNTQTLRVGQLSDGYRVVLGLVMDLARRMAQANSKEVIDGMEIVNPLDLPAIGKRPAKSS
jgi:predicted ATP-binding protein involved in virulence